MTIYTSYFARLNKLPCDVIPVSICGKAPDWYAGLQYKKLAPNWSIFSEYKSDGNIERYTDRFNIEVLGKLDRLLILEELNRLSGDKDVALICYEKPSDFCHRRLVSNWLSTPDNQIKEYGVS